MKQNKMNRAGKALSVYTAAALLLLAVFFSLLFFPKKATADDPTVVTYVSVEVKEGDTLWDYAEQYAPATLSNSDYIHKVCKINRLAGTQIVSGTYIILPVYTVPEC